MSDVGRWTLASGRLTMDAGRVALIFDAGCLKSVVGHWMMDV